MVYIGFHWKSHRWQKLWISSHIVLNDFVNNTAQTIQVESIGAINADNRHSHGYYMAGFYYSPHTLRVNKTIDRHEK